MTTEPIALDGETLSVAQVVSVARARCRVTLSPAAQDRIEKSRAMVEVLLKANVKVYGLTTGFGKLRDVHVSAAESGELQLNLIRSHACGVGRPLPEDVVRAAILLRINTFCRGNSGIRLAAVNQLVSLLNDDVYPYVPEQGSLGASGDLAPLSHVVLVLIGDAGGRYFPRARRDGNAPVRTPRTDDFVHLPAPEGRAALAAAEGWTFGFVTLEAKEGLALNNGTQFMTAIACLVVHDARLAFRHAELAAALSLEAQGGVRNAFDARIHKARPQRHQAEVAERIRAYTAGSTILDLHLNSASVGTASRRVKDAQAEIEGILQRADPAQHGGLLAVQDHLAQLAGDLGAIVPADDGPTVRRWQALLGGDQLKEIRAHLQGVRHQAAVIHHALFSVGFPVEDDRARTRSTVAAAIQALDDATPAGPKVQDDYSFRCFPQVMGTAWHAIEHVAEVVAVEVNSSTDNPLLFPPDPQSVDPTLPPLPEWEVDAYREWLSGKVDLCSRAVIGGGNFHGEPIAVAMDYLKIAMAEVGSIAERRVAHLVDVSLSNGLPPFLTLRGGVSSGLMIPQYCAAALVSENKVLCHPASVDSIPTCANSEDHVSMGTIAARKAAEVVENVLNVIAIELFTGAHAVSFRRPLEPGMRVRQAVAILGRGAPDGSAVVLEDRVYADDFQRVRGLMEGALAEVLIGEVG
jgi:histidine ammonia-lyase